MLSAARAAFRSRLLPTWRTIPTRSYHLPIPSYRPYTRKSQLWYRPNGTPRSKLIGALNVSFLLIFAFTAHTKTHRHRTESLLCLLIFHEIDNRDYDFSTIKDSLDYFFSYVALDKGEVKERTLDMLKTSPSFRQGFRKHLEEFRDMLRNQEEEPVKSGYAVYYKLQEMLSDLELRLSSLPTFEAERLFPESRGGRDRYRKSQDEKLYEEVG